MLRPNTLQLGPLSLPVDYSLAERTIKPLRGRFYALENAAPEKIGEIYLADDTKAAMQADIVTVIAVGAGVELKPGEQALVRPTHGDWIEDAVFGSYVAPERVRVYGVACEFQGEPVEVAWDECAVCKVHSVTEKCGRKERVGEIIYAVKLPNRAGAGCYSFEGVKVSNDIFLEATGRNILIRRDSVVDSQNGVILPDSEKYRTCKATVVSVGPQVREVRVGDRVHYNPMGLLDFLFGDDPDLAVCTELGINAVIEEAA